MKPAYKATVFTGGQNTSAFQSTTYDDSMNAATGFANNFVGIKKKKL